VLPPPLQVPAAMFAPPPLSAAAAAAPAGSDCSGTNSFSAALAARMGLGPVACSSSVAASPEMSTAAAAAVMASTAMPDAAAYGGLDGMAGFGLCSPPSLPGLSAAMSLPVSFDSEGYLRSISGDLDAAADMSLGAGAGCSSPCRFST
jgi:hypothetical protein